MIADAWIDDLPHLRSHLDAAALLSPRDYALALRRFLRRLLKQPASRVRSVLHVAVPMDASGEGDIRIDELLRMPRDKLFRGLDLIAKYDGDFEAALAAEPDGVV